MKTLYLVRHAKTEKIAPQQRDFDRKLLPKGIEVAHRMAKQFQQTYKAPKILLTSAALRARETAEIFAQEFEFPQKQILVYPELYEVTLENLIEFFQIFEPEWDRIMLFGHNPVLEEALPFLIKNASSLSMSPGTIAGILLNVQSWSDRLRGKGELLCFYDPKSD